MKKLNIPMLLICLTILLNLNVVPAVAGENLTAGVNKIMYSVSRDDYESDDTASTLAGATGAIYKILNDSKTSVINNDLVEVGASENEVTTDGTIEVEEENFDQTGYASTAVVHRAEATKDSDKIQTIYQNSTIHYIKSKDDWTKVKYNGKIGYIMTKYISDKPIKIETANNDSIDHQSISSNWSGEKLTRSNGRVPSPGGGTETFYNMNMSGVIRIMRGLGYTGEYWVRSDGCKMLGNYIMVAAKIDQTHKRGRIVQTTLGMGIVCDTGGFVRSNPLGYDIATTW